MTDADIVASCDKCGSTPLSTCLISQAAETTYTCAKCGNTLVIIGAPNPDGQPWPGRGYRITDFVVRNAVDLHYNRVLIPRSPNALAKEDRKSTRLNSSPYFAYRQ